MPNTILYERHGVWAVWLDGLDAYHTDLVAGIVRKHFPQFTFYVCSEGKALPLIGTRAKGSYQHLRDRGSRVLAKAAGGSGG